MLYGQRRTQLGCGRPGGWTDENTGGWSITSISDNILKQQTCVVEFTISPIDSIDSHFCNHYKHQTQFLIVVCLHCQLSAYQVIFTTE